MKDYKQILSHYRFKDSEGHDLLDCQDFKELLDYAASRTCSSGRVESLIASDVTTPTDEHVYIYFRWREKNVDARQCTRCLRLEYLNEKKRYVEAPLDTR